MAFDFSYPNSSAQERGWGPGWPNCQFWKMVPIQYPSFSASARIRREIHDLLVLLLAETERRGYSLRGPVIDDWAFVCRATKRSNGTTTDVPSNHSWGLAVDLNALRNPYGGTTHDMPAWVVKLWGTYGWRWLGPPIHDWEHFDFCGTPDDARRMTLKARAELGGDKMTDKELAQLHEALRTSRMIAAAVEDFLHGRTPADLPMKPENLVRRHTLRALIAAANRPK